jgi:hypothetical protein
MKQNLIVKLVIYLDNISGSGMDDFSNVLLLISMLLYLLSFMQSMQLRRHERVRKKDHSKW